MTRTLNLRRPMALAVAAGVLAGVVSMGVAPAHSLRQAAAADECDAQCWAILKYLTDQGLTPQQIEDLGNSGIPPAAPAPPVTQPPTATQPPAPVTTQPPTTTQPHWNDPADDPPPSNSPVCSGGSHCENIKDGIDQGWYPKNLDHGEPTEVADLREVLEDFGAQHPNFDTQAALGALDGETGDADRFDMAKALANGLGISFADDDPSTPGDERMDAVRELADLGIVFGYDGDSSTVSDQDFGGSNHMTNGQMASFLNRIKTPSSSVPGGSPVTPGGPGGSPTPGGPGGSPTPGGPGGSPTPGSPYVPPVDPDEVCTTGLPLTQGQGRAFAAQLKWKTLVPVESASRPGAPWPPHPEVPGGRQYLVVSESPVWPVVDPGTQWVTVDPQDGCVWLAIEVRTSVSQMLPWRAGHRAALEAAGGFDVFLSRWDNMSAEERGLAAQRHVGRDINVRCALATTKVSADSYDRCRWELAASSVWSWQAVACFEAASAVATFRECATLASGIEWFRAINDYTQQTTAHSQPAGGYGPVGRASAR